VFDVTATVGFTTAPSITVLWYSLNASQGLKRAETLIVLASGVKIAVATVMPLEAVAFAA
jgi:hypothetical protein